MIRFDGWHEYSIWEHSSRVKQLYARRCRREEEEMTCAAQAAELLAPYASEGDTLLDVGCGSGYFFHSLNSRNIPVTYHGIDASPSLIEIGRQYLPKFGLASTQLQVARIEDLAGHADHVVCMNVLSNLDNYHRPLERLLRMARKTLILRESCALNASYCYVEDKYLDGNEPLKVYVNTYDETELLSFIRDYGFTVDPIIDRRSAGQPEMVIDYPHYWKFILAVRNNR